jgi:hypothetical protein
MERIGGGGGVYGHFQKGATVAVATLEKTSIHQPDNPP